MSVEQSVENSVEKAAIETSNVSGNRLAGRVALVTGAGQGIGRAIALQYAAEGAAVGVLDIKADLAEATVGLIEAAGGRALALPGNVGERAAFVDAISTLEATYGRFDLMVNNAIWVRYGPIDSITEVQLDRMVATGFNSVVWGMQCAAAAMARAGGGTIINIASVAGYLGMPNAMVYCGVKAGVMGLTRSAATELGPQNIRVNAIAPGSVPTEGVQVNVDQARMQSRIDRTPLRRLGAVEDIANAALFLATPESGFVTGAVLTVDGGIAHAFS